MLEIKKVKNIPELIVKEIVDALGENHISSLIYGSKITSASNDEEDNDLAEDMNLLEPIRLFIVVNSFDESCLLKLSVIFNKWKKILGDRVESPYITEHTELLGILDSVPEKILELRTNYKVIAGEDLKELSSEPEYEYLRAQIELTVRHYVYTLRHDLFEVLFDKKGIEEYLRELWVFCISTLRFYHRVTKPTLKTTPEHIQAFNQEFPDCKGILSELLEKIYRIVNNDSVTSIGKASIYKLSVSILGKVLHPILIKIDNLGPNKGFRDQMSAPKDNLVDTTIELKLSASDPALKAKIEAAFRARELQLQKRLKKLFDDYKAKYNKKVEIEMVKLENALTNKFEAEQHNREKEMEKINEIDKANYLETKLSEERAKLKHEYERAEKSLIKESKQKEKELLKELKNSEKSLIKQNKEKVKEFQSIQRQLEKGHEQITKKLRFELEMSEKELELRKRVESEILDKKQDLKQVLELEIECERNKLETKRLKFDLSLKDKELEFAMQNNRARVYHPPRDIEKPVSDDRGIDEYEQEEEEDLFKKIRENNKILKWGTNESS